MDLAELLRIVRRRYLLGVGVALGFIVAVTIFAFVAPASFSATSTIEVLPSAPISADPTKAPTTVAADDAKIDTELQFINSNTVLGAVVNKAGLMHDEEFAGDDPTQVTPSATTDALNAATKVTRRGTSYLIDIVVNSKSPSKAAMLANAVADNYITESDNIRRAVAAHQISELNRQLGELAVQVKGAESEAASYRGATGIVAGAAGTVTDQQITGVAGAVATADSAAADARSRANAAQQLINGGDLTSVASVVASPTILDLRRQRGDLLREKAKNSANYGPKHPETIRVNGEIANIDAEIQAEANRIVQGLKSEAVAAESRSATLHADMENLRRRQASDASASVSGDALSREATAKRQIYDQLALTAQQAMQNQGLDPGRSRIVERATTPSQPTFPNKKLLLALGVLVGAAAGGAAIFVAEALDQGVRTVRDVEDRLKLAALVTLPHLRKRDMARAGVRDGYVPDYVLNRPVSPYAESVRTLRTSLQWGQGANSRVIGITSAIPSEGKSSVAAAMARVMAMGGSRTLLIDADLRMAKQMARVRDRPAFGLVEVLMRGAPVEQALYKDMENLYILGPLQPEFMAADVLNGQALRALIDGLKDQFDHIIIDTPPILSVADATVIATVVDTSVMVIRWKNTPVSAVRRARDQITDVGGQLAGAVLNDVEAAGWLKTGDDAGYYRDVDLKYFKT